MGGQACVLYGAAEFSRNLDLAVHATDSALPRLTAALQSLHATVIAVPPFEAQFKDWPMIRRLVDASYDSARDSDVSPDQVEFWLSELRTPEFLREAVSRFPDHASTSRRPAIMAAVAAGDIASALAAEQAYEMAIDRAYWEPLRRELEALRHAARRS